VDQQTAINLTVSLGPGPAAQARSLEFELPRDKDYYKVVVKVKDTRGERKVYDQMHEGGDTVIIGISYFGSGQAEIQLNGTPYRTINL